MFTFKHAVVGGTFDHLHEGHKELLEKAFNHSEKVQIGLTTKQLSQDKTYSMLIQSYDERKKNLEQYLAAKRYTKRSEIVAITDIFGTTLRDKSIQAIFITEENIPNVEIINAERLKRGFPILEAVVIPYRTSDQGDVVSAGNIRAGNQSRAGISYHKTLLRKKQFTLPDTLRQLLHEPIDTLVHDVADIQAFQKDSTMMIAVGDVIATSLCTSDHQADISIIDHITRRHTAYAESDILEKASDVTTTRNAQGTIERSAIEAIDNAIAGFQETNIKQTIRVTGEEDLLVIPAVLLAPLNSLVVYGQFDRGIVLVRVTETKKEEIAQLLKKFR